MIAREEVSERERQTASEALRREMVSETFRQQVRQ